MTACSFLFPFQEMNILGPQNSLLSLESCLQANAVWQGPGSSLFTRSVFCTVWLMAVYFPARDAPFPCVNLLEKDSLNGQGIVGML